MLLSYGDGISQLVEEADHVSVFFSLLLLIIWTSNYPRRI